MKHLLQIIRLISYLFMAMLFQYATAKQIPFRGANVDHKADIINAINSLSSSDNVIEFESGKVYGIRGSLVIPRGKNIIFRTVNNSNNRAVLRVTSNNIGNFITLNRVVNFSKLIIDGGGNTASNSYTILINLNNMPNVQFNNCVVRNFNGIGIASKASTLPNYTNGLKVRRTTFKDISGNSAILLIDRRTNRRDSNGNILGAKGTALQRFSSPVIIENSRFEGRHSVAIRSDCGNDFYKINGEQGVRRYNQSTNVNATINNNFFGPTVRWNIGMVQVSGMRFTNNTFLGGGSTGKGNGACFHIEQFCRNITLANNTFNIGNSFGVSFAAKEGYQRFTENPIILFDNKGGRAHSSAEGSNSCTQRTPFVNSKKNCKRDVHSYGPRNFIIHGNTFNALGNNVKTAFQITDAENFQFGTTANGRSKNIYTGKFTAGALVISQGDLGNKNIIINDNITPCQIKTNRNVWFGNNRANIKLNGSNFNGCSSQSKVLNTNEVNENKSSRLINNRSEFGAIEVATNTTENYDFEIYDLSGTLIKKDNNTIGADTHNIDVRAISPGIYILKMKNFNTAVTEKFIRR